MTISQLIIYPIKSFGGISVRSAQVTDRGFKYDRRWMLVDAEGRFISQREVPVLALFRPEITASGLTVTYASDHRQIHIPFKPATNEVLYVTIWDDRVVAQRVSTVVDNWFTSILGRPCSLVYMPDECRRAVDPEYARDKITSFSDAYPFLLIGQSSLNDLNRRLKLPIPMNRFRPNIVFTGGHPYIEDEMQEFTVDNIRFYGVKLCARCPVPGIDQDTAQAGKEPLKTLASYRRMANNVLMGQNLVHEGEGIIKIGDVINVISYKPKEF